MPANYCAWAGKRLPDGSRMGEKQPAGQPVRAFPWGDQAPTCTLGNLLCGWLLRGRYQHQLGSYPLGARPVRRVRHGQATCGSGSTIGGPIRIITIPLLATHPVQRRATARVLRAAPVGITEVSNCAWRSAKATIHRITTSTSVFVVRLPCPDGYRQEIVLLIQAFWEYRFTGRNFTF